MQQSKCVRFRVEKKSIKLNYLYNASYQVLMVIVPLITAPYISRKLGADGIGIYSFAESILAYFTMFANLGTATYAQREISYCQQDKRKRSEVFWNVIAFRVISTASCTLLYVAYAFSRPENQIIYIILTLNLLGVAADITWFYQGVEEFKKIVGRNYICKIINIIYIFTFIKKQDDLVWYVLGNSIIYFVSNASLWLYLPKYIEPIKYDNLKPFVDLKTILALFVPTIAIRIYTVLDKTMIGVLTQSAAENGYYEQSMRIAKMILAIVTSLGAVMIPRIGHHFAQREKKIVQDYMYKGYRFVWFLGIPLALGIFGVSDNMVPWFFGEGYDRVAVLLKVVCFLIIAIGINNLTGMQYLISTKRENLFTKSVIIGAVSNFFLNLLLIPKLYSVGAAIASVIAETIIAVVQLVWMRKELSISKILKSSINYWIAGGVMLVALSIFNKYFSSTIINTFIMVAGGAVVYIGLLFIARDSFFMENVNSILKRLKVK